MLSEGADFFRPWRILFAARRDDISTQEETDRLLPAVEAIVRGFPDAILSIDTFRAQVAEAAVKAGAHIINDISGGNLMTRCNTVARLQVPYILMHMKGNPNMNQLLFMMMYSPKWYDYFADKCYQLKQLGVYDVIIDPGFGFAKKPEQGYQLMKPVAGF